MVWDGGGIFSVRSGEGWYGVGPRWCVCDVLDAVCCILSKLTRFQEKKIHNMFFYNISHYS